MKAEVLVAGYYGSGNAGDEAILAALLQDVRVLRPDLGFVVVSANPPETAARFGVRAVGTTDIPAIIDAAHDAKVILLGGGGIFQDYWGCASESMLTRDHVGIPFYAGFPMIAALTGKPCMIYAAGVGPLQSEEGRTLTRTACEQANLVTVRDVASRDLLQEIGVAGADVRVTADPAFTLRPDLDQADRILSRFSPDRGAPVVAVCLRSWTVDGRPGKWEYQVAPALDAFIERSGAVVLFVPFQTLTQHFLTDDIAVADRVIDRMARRTRAAIVRECESPQALAGVLARCHLVVGMRLHSLIFAAKAGVPAVGLPYDPKVTNIMTRLGVDEYAIPLTEVPSLGERMAMAWDRRDAIRACLTVRSAALRALAEQNATLAVGLLDGHGIEPARAPAVDWLSAFALTQSRRLARQQELAEELAARVSAREEELSAVSLQADELVSQVATFRGSLTWRAAERLRRWRGRLAPRSTMRDRALRAAVDFAMATAQRGLAASLAEGGERARAAGRRWLTKPRGIWTVEYREERNGTVTLYTDRDDLFAGYRLRKPLSARRDRRARVSLIATVRNERAGIPRWMASVAAQTRLPDEIVVVDAGSTDGSRAELEAQAQRMGLTLTVLTEPGANIARGRNRAIERARGGILAATDLGCRLTPHWLERIIAPFEDDETMEVVAGWYVALERGQPQQRRRWPTLDQIAPGSFIPSSRSIAFTREAWAAVGGYPEWLTLTGEDTWFALELGRFCERWAFVPEAVVEWDAPATMTEYWRKIHAWSIGDGESSVGARHYWRSFRRAAGVAAAGVAATGTVAVAAALGAQAAMLALAGTGLAGAVALWRHGKSLGSVRSVAWEAGAEAARAIGFVRGARRRADIAARRHEGDAGTVVMLSGVPIDDTGGGARSTQLALEFLKQGWSVVFVSRFPRYETRDLGLKIRHPRLLTAALEDFPWRRFIRDHRRVFDQCGVAAIVEFPLAEFLPLARAIRKVGGSVIYDLLDNWDSSLGGDWYSAESERRLIALSDVLIATAAPLAARLREMSGRDVTLVPNAVNTDLFDPRPTRRRPEDYPAAPWSMIYVGALWGDWFDWHLLRRLALAYPEAAVVIVGDYRTRMAFVPGNVHFLGLKAQVDLPSYLAHADVAIVPWKTNAVTHATSPLKVYEYLAMRRPVVAPRLDALAGIPGVLLSNDTDEFVRNVGRARETPIDQVVIDQFVRQNAWAARVGTLLGPLTMANARFATGRADPESGRPREGGAGFGLRAIRPEDS